jgi:hypothetical protein
MASDANETANTIRRRIIRTILGAAEIISAVFSGTLQSKTNGFRFPFFCRRVFKLQEDLPFLKRIGQGQTKGTTERGEYPYEFRGSLGFPPLRPSGAVSPVERLKVCGNDGSPNSNKFYAAASEKEPRRF